MLCWHCVGNVLVLCRCCVGVVLVLYSFGIVFVLFLCCDVFCCIGIVLCGFCFGIGISIAMVLLLHWRFDDEALW